LKVLITISEARQGRLSTDCWILDYLRARGQSCLNPYC